MSERIKKRLEKIIIPQRIIFKKLQWCIEKENLQKLRVMLVISPSQYFVKTCRFKWIDCGAIKTRSLVQ